MGRSVQNLNPHGLQDRRLGVQRLAPFIDAGLLGVVQSGLVAAMPMRALLQAAIVADQDDARDAELDGQVHRLEAAVAAPADHAELIEEHVADLPGLDVADAGELGRHPTGVG